MPKVDDDIIANAQMRRARLSLALDGIDRQSPPIRAMLATKLDLRFPLRMPDGAAALEFACPLDEACMAADIVRGGDREAGEAITGAWIKLRSGWVRIPSGSILAVEVNGEWVPNPAVFREAVSLPRQAPPKLF